MKTFRTNIRNLAGRALLVAALCGMPVVLQGCGSGGTTSSTSGTSTATLTASATTATSGTSITLTAAVSPSGATGTVTFYDGTTSIGTGTLSSGSASLATSSLSVGSHSITAVYAGSSSYSGSTSSAVTITITSAATSTATTTTLTTSSTATTYGTSITLTAAVSPTAATGTVTFTDTTASASLGTGTLSSGVATLSTSALAVGTHVITATYAGATVGTVTYAASTSASVSVVVASSSSSSSCSSYTGTPLIVCLANAYYATLTTAQQTLTLYTYNRANAIIWSNLPTAMVSRNGVKFGDMSTTSSTAALALMQAVLSSDGYTRFTQLRLADDYLAANGGGTSSYGAGRYFVAFLGSPSTTSAWQLQIGGHHYALNVTYNGTYASATPFFLGVEPPSFTTSGTTYTVMEKQRAAAYALGQSLVTNTTTKSSALLSGSFDDVVHGANGSTSHDDNYPQAYPTTGRGALYSSLTTAQQALIKTYIEAWVNDQNSTTVSALLPVYEDATALASTYVGYAGSGAFTTQGDYIRVDGPRIWIEFVVQNGIVIQGGIHYHSIWRDKTADYGADF